MLTILEAKAAILGLDTPKDVIYGACLDVLRSAGGPEDSSIGQKAKELGVRLRQMTDSIPERLEVVWTLAAWEAVACSPEGAESKMLQQMLKYVVEEFKSAFKQKVEHMMRMEPEKAAGMLLAALRNSAG
jgi:hypothetical protein